MSLSKSTVYYWFKHFGGYQVSKVDIKRNCEGDLGETIGIFAGDGNYTFGKDYKHTITISLNAKDLNYINDVAPLFEKVCSKKPWIYSPKGLTVARVRFRSKKLIEVIRSYLSWNENKTLTVRLKENLDNYSEEFIIGFLRGLMDTDGWIGNNIAKFSTISFPLARNIEKLLEKLDISYQGYVQYDETGRRKPIYRIVIVKGFDKFIEMVKPKHFKYIHAK